MTWRKHFIKRGIAKRILYAITTIMLITLLSAMTFYSAASSEHVIPSDYCNGDECCLSNDCSCPNCTGIVVPGSFPEVIIEDYPLPLFSAVGRDFFLFAPMGVPTWSIFNLILTATGILLSILTILRAIKQKKDEFNEINEYATKLMTDDSAKNEELLAFIAKDEHFIKRRRLIALVIMYIFSFGAALLLLLTQNFKGAVAVFDIWSVVHAVMFTCLLISGNFVFKKFRKEQIKICTA